MAPVPQTNWPLVPLTALALAIGILVRHPLLAVPLLLPTLVHPRLRALRAPVLALLAGTLLPAPPSASLLLRLFPEGADLVRLQGTVLRGPDLPARGGSRLDLEVDTVGGHPVPGRVRVLLPEGAPSPSPGARVAVVGRLALPRAAANPGEHDARRSLSLRGITHLLVARAAPSLEVVRPASAPAPAALAHRARLALDGALSRLGDPETAGFLSCLLLGRRDRLPDEVESAFRRSGTSHFLAISGLHVGIVAGALWWALRLLAVPRRPAAVLLAAVAVTYAAMTGMRPPVLRACVLVVLFAGATLARRRSRPLDLVAVAVIVVLLGDPQAIDRVGFQLSFTAVLAIILLARKIEEGLFARRKLVAKFSVPRSRPLVLRVAERYAIRSIPVSLAAWLGTAPLVLSRFGMLPLLVVPANLLVFPLVALLIPLGFLAAATGLVLPASILVAALTGVVAGVASVPYSCPTLPPPPTVALVAWYAGLLLLSRLPRIGRLPLALALAALGGLAASGPLFRSRPPEPSLTVLSVGHAVAVVLETPEGGVLLYDVGSRRPRVAERVVIPYLLTRGIASVDGLVLSHGDADHVNGAGSLLERLPTGRVWEPGDLRAGDRITLPGARIDVLWPPEGADLVGNDTSTVLRMRTGSLTALLTGDLEEEGIRGLLESGADVRADVLVVPHHGRTSPAAAALHAAVRPSLLLSSDGPENGLDPAWRAALRTSVRGAITVRPGGRTSTFR